jgi:hypothetical protein
MSDLRVSGQSRGDAKCCGWTGRGKHRCPPKPVGTFGLGPSLPQRDDFHKGVLAALAIVADFDSETLYREIVRTVGIENLLGALEPDARAEDAQHFGLVRYRYTDRLGRRRPDDRG